MMMPYFEVAVFPFHPPCEKEFSCPTEGRRSVAELSDRKKIIVGTNLTSRVLNLNLMSKSGEKEGGGKDESV
jgi:hypothetical protein